jgi:hypothetical protein
LVHGDAEAREMLANSLSGTSKLAVELPRSGDSYEAAAGSRRRAASPTARLNPLALWPPWDPIAPRELDLARFHAWLVSLTPRLSWVTVEELAELWKSPETVTDADLADLRTALANQPHPYFVPEARRPFLLRLTPPENLPGGGGEVPRSPVEQAAVLAQDMFPPESGLRRFGFYPQEGTVRLEFPFPRASARHLRSRFADFTHRTGWEVSVNDDTDPADLIRFARELSVHIEPGPVEICHLERRVQVAVPDLRLLPEASRLQTRYLHHTGYRLEFLPLAETAAESGMGAAESDLDPPTGG